MDKISLSRKNQIAKEKYSIQMKGKTMGTNDLTGTPWHVETLHRSEGDERRYKGRCKYYSYEKDRCSMRSGRCKGSAHCMEYIALSDEAFKAKQKLYRNHQKSKDPDEDIYWY